MNYPSFTTQEEGHQYLEGILNENENEIKNYNFKTGMSYGPNLNLSGESLTIYFTSGDVKVFSYYICE